MKPDKEFKFITLMLLLFLVISLIYTIITRNAEFALYTPLMILFVIVLYHYHKKLHLTNYLLAALSIEMILHVLGGVLFFKGIRLYAMHFGAIGYDNLTHVFGMFVFTLIAYNFLRPHLDKSIKKSPIYFAAILLIFSAGLGAINEMLEFMVVLFWENGAHLIGDYYNTLWDLIANLLGATCAIILAIKYHLR